MTKPLLMLLYFGLMCMLSGTVLFYDGLRHEPISGQKTVGACMFTVGTLLWVIVYAGLP